MFGVVLEWFIRICFIMFYLFTYRGSTPLTNHFSIIKWQPTPNLHMDLKHIQCSCEKVQFLYAAGLVISHL